jgi:uncharacterized protein (TIGR01440 family)
MENLELIASQLTEAAQQVYTEGRLKKGDIVIIGCSTSTVAGSVIGTDSRPELGKFLFETLYNFFSARGVYLAAQCCEHLNRAVIVERAAVPGYDIVNVVPQPKAGGSFATACYAAFRHPVALEEIRADAGLDIGGTLIGMHLKKVAVPVRLPQKTIGQAMLLAARVRPKFIGGERAFYDDSLKDGYPRR